MEPPQKASTVVFMNTYRVMADDPITQRVDTMTVSHHIRFMSRSTEMYSCREDPVHWDSLMTLSFWGLYCLWRCPALCGEQW